MFSCRNLAQTLVLAAALAALPSLLFGADRIKLLAGNTSNGSVTSLSPTEVVIEVGSTKRTFPVNEIESITFDSEPNELTQARFAVASGRYDDALGLLEKVDAKDVTREAIAADIDFYKGYAEARRRWAATARSPRRAGTC